MLWNSIAGLLDSVLNKFIPDANTREQFKQEVLKAFESSDLAQVDLDKIEAASPNWFVAGWRPFIGWVCGIGLLYQYLLQPLVSWSSSLLHGPIPPALDLGTLMTVLMGMLGMSGLRSWEKQQGVHRE